MYQLESSFQPKGPRFKPFLNYFSQQMKWMKKFMERLNQLPLGSNFLKQKKTKCQSQASSQWSKNYSLLKNTTSLQSNEFSLGKGPSFPKEKGTFLGEQCTFPKKRPKFHWETYVPNLFAITIISFLFSYVIATYHWKGFEKNYNFVGGNIPIKIHM